MYNLLFCFCITIQFVLNKLLHEGYREEVASSCSSFNAATSSDGDQHFELTRGILGSFHLNAERRPYRSLHPGLLSVAFAGFSLCAGSQRSQIAGGVYIWLRVLFLFGDRHSMLATPVHSHNTSIQEIAPRGTIRKGENGTVEETAKAALLLVLGANLRNLIGESTSGGFSLRADDLSAISFECEAEAVQMFVLAQVHFTAWLRATYFHPCCFHNKIRT